MKNYFLYTLLFVSGFWIPSLFLFLILIFITLNLKTIFLAKNKESFLVLFLLLLFSLSYVFFWSDKLIPSEASYFKDKELKMFFLLPIYTCGFYLIFIINNNFKSVRKGLFIFTLGMLLKSVLVTYFTWFNFPELIIQRKIFDPLKNTIGNSPGYAVMSCFCGLYSIDNFFRSKVLLHKVLFIVIVLLSISIGFLLQARSFFVIVMVFILIRYFRLFFNVKNLVVAIISCMILYFSFNFFIEYLSSENKIFRMATENSFNRFENEGIESNRFSQWSSSFDKIMNKPFGGSSTDKSIERTHWFHNFLVRYWKNLRNHSSFSNNFYSVFSI